MTSERPTEGAAFDLEQLEGGRRQRPRVLASGFIVVLGLVVGAGVIGRLSAGAFPSTGENIALTSSPASVLASDVAATPPIGPAFPADTGPLLSSGPGDLELLAKRHAETIFVHGDVYPAGVTWVFMSLRDDTGQVGGWASVSVPGAAGPAASGAPTMRFDVELAIPASFDANMWVQALAYDARFGLIASARVDAPVAAP